MHLLSVIKYEFHKIYDEKNSHYSFTGPPPQKRIFSRYVKGGGLFASHFIMLNNFVHNKIDIRH